MKHPGRFQWITGLFCALIAVFDIFYFAMAHKIAFLILAILAGCLSVFNFLLAAAIKDANE